MTDPTITPASDEDLKNVYDGGYSAVHNLEDWLAMLFARIEADRATIAKQAKEIERLRGSLAALVRMHFHPDGRPYEMPAHEMRVVEDARSALSKPKE